MRRYEARFTPTLISSSAWIDVLQRNESADSGAKLVRRLGIVSIWQVLPGKSAEFMDLWRTEYLPRYKKAGVSDVWVYSTAYGGPMGQVTIVRPIGKYADLDQTPGVLQRGGLSPEAAAKLNARRASLVSGAQQTVMRYLPDLSYGMPARATN